MLIIPALQAFDQSRIDRTSRTSFVAPGYCLQFGDFALQDRDLLAQLLDDARAYVGIL